MILIYAATGTFGMAVIGLALRRIEVSKKLKNTIFIIIMAALAIMLAFPITGALLPDGPLCWFFQKWGNIFAGYVMYYFMALLVIAIIEIVVWFIRRIKKKEKKPGRGAVIMAVLPLIITIAVNIMGVRTAHDVKVTNYSLDKEVLGQSESVRIVLFADTHIGVNSTPKIYEDMVERINEQNADLVVIAGDLVTSSFGAMRDPEGYAAIMRGIRSRYGVYAVYGNHDVDEPLLGGFSYAGRENAHRNPAMEGWVKDCGWNLLTDDVVKIPELNSLVIAGRRDEERPGDGIMERAELDELLKDVRPEEPVLLLQHEPSDLEDLEEFGVDLSVSGHTHNGQIFPGNIITRLLTDQAYGMRNWGEATAVVTSGVGYYGPPIRVCTISEIVVIDLI